ncbi:LPS export ABC transporter periplasmic protein LptC [Dechloromonas sp. TW-R-39-2]|uniref:LPS export ABC transporter periplasmic protein LptC n=1 Tax=Dechloromonas sp. TW-R-39-2 TaxID=2654218 RepID=UPI00193D478F|nr:LPS export ABC transporter periplasmic protein LptC [Dechloromonas sp. TW-R-39-2]QRM20619.1 LPS export ABC transporter periplasmic protein LptC [Dechloromonas sp. TW-R-39-2]
MKHWPSQLFPIILLALLAALSFWLQKTVDQEEQRHDSKLRHDPDAIAENFIARRFNEDGQVKYRLTAPYLVHYPDDDSSELKSPVLTSYRPEAPPVTVSSKNGKVTSKGETVYLWDDVVLTRAATPTRPEMMARMPDLTAKPDAGTAFTNNAVEITQGQSWVKGIGANLDNNNATLVLQSQVTGLYIRPKASK